MALSKLMNRPTPLIIGHRGCPAKRPENTMASFEQALLDGADMIEFDVQLSADGLPMVIHDPDLSLTTSGTGQIWQCRGDEVCSLDAGCWYDKKFKGECVPRLADVLETFGQRVLMNIELKPDCLCRPEPGPTAVALVVEMVRAAGLMDRVLISSFSYDALRIVRAMDSGANLAVLSYGPENGADPVLLCRAVGAISLNPDIEYLEKSTVERLHEAGLAVLPYGGGPDQTEPMKKALALDCDGFFADDPGAWAEMVGR